MGISGLLPFCKKASKHSHIKHFSGQTVVVDAYSWLYKGAFGCAVQLGKGEPTNVYINYCMKYVNVLLDHGLKPILVFDGRSLPAKAITNAKRREKRIEYKEKAREALRRGDSKEAWECFTKCIEVTPEMARGLIKVLREKKIDYIIAPYEADAQMAYLARTGMADLILTEDSDLIVFGCAKIFFKMSLNGDGIVFDQSKLHKCIGLPPEKFHFDKFRQMCILSGCDYLPSLPGIGLARAKRVFTTSINPDVKRVLKQIPIILKLDLEVSEEYIQQFIEAEQTFLYQLVFNPKKRELLPLNPYPAHLETNHLPFAGSYENEKIMANLCLGNIDTKSLQKVDTFDPEKFGYPSTSIWSKNFKISERVNPFVEMKRRTKHTSTIGKSASISLAVPGLSAKRVTRKTMKTEAKDVADEKELNDEELVSMYSFSGSSTTIKYETQEIVDDMPSLKRPNELVDEFSSRSKRRCNKGIYNVSRNSSTENDETDGQYENISEDDAESPIPKRANDESPVLKRQRAKDPFSKNEPGEDVPLILSKLKAKIQENHLNQQSVCSIEKNKIYKWDLDNPKIVVKSKYFRESDAKSQLQLRKSPRTKTAISTI